MYKYVLIGNHHKALAIHSDMNWIEICDYIASKSRRLHPDSNETVFSWGMIDFVHPRIILSSAFIDTCPALIGIK